MKCIKCGCEIKVGLNCPKCHYNYRETFENKSKLSLLINSYNDAGLYSTSIDILKYASRLGYSNAMVIYGSMFEKGLGVPKSNRNIIYCYSKAAALHNSEANLFMAKAYAYGKYDLPVDSFKAKLYLDAVDKNMIIGEWELFYHLGMRSTELNTNKNGISNSETVNIQSNNVSNLYKPIENLNSDDNSNILDDSGYSIEVDSNGEFIDVDGQLKKFSFDIPDDYKVCSSNILEEEKINLENFYLDYNNKLKTDLSRIESQEKNDSIGADPYSSYNAPKTNLTDEYANLNDLREFPEPPYYGRIKVYYKERDSHIDRYIGDREYTSNDGKFVISSWTTGIGKFYSNNVEVKSVINDDEVSLEEKRIISIADKKVKNVSEIFHKGMKNILIADDFLFDLINERSQLGEATDIVSTMSLEQNELIRANSNENFILQGYAGTGKSMIMLHRLKYQIDNNVVDPDKTYVVAQSNRFIESIKTLEKRFSLNTINISTMSNLYIHLLSKYTGNRFKLFFKSTVTVTNVDGYNRPNSHLDIKHIKILSDNSLDPKIVEYYYSKTFFDSVQNLKKINIQNITKSSVHDNLINGELDLMGYLIKKHLNLLPKYKRKLHAIHKCELYALLLFYYVRCGHNLYHPKKSVTHNVKFNIDNLIIDEGQDYSLSEYKLLQTITNSNTMNIYGDLNQQLTNYCIKSWDELKLLGDFNYYELTKNYRNTSQIVNYTIDKCNISMDSIGRSGVEVEIIDSSYYSLESLNFSNIKNHNICYITKNKKEIELPSYVEILTPYSAKGLEFNTVIVNIKSMSLNEKYLSFTRSLNKLIIIE